MIKEFQSIQECNIGKEASHETELLKSTAS
jgi:hypothetical protein